MNALSQLVEKINTKHEANWVGERIQDMFEDFKAENQNLYDSLDDLGRKEVQEIWYSDLIDRL